MSRRRSRVIEKRKRRAKDSLRAVHRRRRDFDQVLETIGLQDLKGRLGGDFSSLLARAFPRPRVVTDPTRPADDDLMAKVQELGGALDGVAIRIGHRTLGHSEYFTTCVGLHHVLEQWLGRPNTPAVRRSLRDHLGRLTTFIDQYDPEMMAELDFVICKFLARVSRLDGPIYTARHGTHHEGDKYLCTTALGRSAPESILIEIDGHRRRAFRCGIADDLETGEVTWAAWHDDIAGPGADGRTPVYIQRHAIHQARRRIGARESEGFVDYFLARSLREPRVTTGRDGKLLIEVKIGGERVGYLVAERLNDKVLVRTFLLITMRGTPEGDRLHRRLRMSRSDLEYLELDYFGVLTNSDLLDDDEVAGIFAEAGCDGLIALARGDHPGKISCGSATQFKDYFGRAVSAVTPPIPPEYADARV